jgi:hypothetical protein
MLTPGMAKEHLPDQKAEHEAGRTGKRDSDAAQRETLNFPEYDRAENGLSIGGGQW